MTLLDEQLFWLEIFQDHAVFLYVSLGSKEEAEQQRAQTLAESLGHIIGDLRDGALDVQNPIIKETVNELLDFKHLLLSKQINCKITLHLPPAITNHMINEIMEYFFIIYCKENAAHCSGTKFLIHQHAFWLMSLSEHAALIRSMLDLTEENLFKEASLFKNSFDSLITDALMLTKYQHYSVFPHLQHLTPQAIKENAQFIRFLNYLESGLKKCDILSTATPFLMNHMARESLYYQNKIKIIMM